MDEVPPTTPPGPAVPDSTRAPAPGPVPLHEMKLGRLLDYAIRIYRYRWRMFLGVSAGIVVPFIALQTLVTILIGPETPGILNNGTVPADASPSQFLVPVIFGIAQVAFLQPFLTGAMSRATSEIYLGRETTSGEILRFAGSIFGSLLLISFLVFLTVFGGFILLIVPGIIFSVRFYLSPVALVTEGLKGRAGMRRAWNLTKGFGWKVFGAIFVSNVLIAIVAAVINVPLTLAGTLIGGDLGVFLTSVGAAVSQVITIPFVGIISVLIYYDLRIRKEAYDLALMAQELGGQPPTSG